MAGKLVCWRCGAALGKVARPFPRLAKCKTCEADLHVCRMCQFYQPRLSSRCDHELAEPAREVDLANFCHYLRLKPDAYLARDHAKAVDAAEKLKALFNAAEEEKVGSHDDRYNLDPLKALFKTDHDSEKNSNE
ncbi:MAG: hypothetical protein OEZ39_07350 [Gammaproteobacteria bacterium]|nr:hypothetical protein [Gammaproteobacteria bacterium]MDH5651674.1 hypothetical protein [Gammaproteobacteria bacterium]